jgi:hypothetical protein
MAQAEVVREALDMFKKEADKVKDSYKSTGLLALTGQESGIVVYGYEGGNRGAIICNWAAVTGLPRALGLGLLVGLPGDEIPAVQGEHRDDIPDLLEGIEILYNANDDIIPQSGTIYRISDSVIVVAPDGWC